MTWTRIPQFFLMTSRQIRDEERRGAGIGHILQKPFYVSALHMLVEQVFEKKAGNGSDEQGHKEKSMAGMRILAAEDNAMNADMLKELLEMAGVRCEIAGNGRAALAMFSNSRPGYYDAILLDIQMPVMDGYAAAEAIRALDREDAKSVPILAMTASTFEEDVTRTYESGMNAHITKPLDIHVLQNHLSRK
jgi:CheY-like chemotaxis protein